MSRLAESPQQLKLLRRLVRFDYRRSRDAAEAIEPFEGGSLVLSPTTALLWRATYLEVETEDRSASALAVLADELLGGRGFRHRSVVPLDPPYGDRLVAGFRELRWHVDRSLYMVLRRAPERRGAPVVEVAREEVAPVRRAVGSRLDAGPETVEQMLVRDARIDERAGGRWFAAFDGDSPASACVLFERDGIGQVETVITAPESRGRGLATSVVLAAVEASRRGGHELTFIVADAEDWPWRLYARLGFDPVGTACTFIRIPRPPPPEIS